MITSYRTITTNVNDADPTEVLWHTSKHQAHSYAENEIKWPETLEVLVIEKVDGKANMTVYGEEA